MKYKYNFLILLSNFLLIVSIFSNESNKGKFALVIRGESDNELSINEVNLEEKSKYNVSESFDKISERIIKNKELERTKIQKFQDILQSLSIESLKSFVASANDNRIKTYDYRIKELLIKHMAERAEDVLLKLEEDIKILERKRERWIVICVPFLENQVEKEIERKKMLIRDF